MKKFSFSHIFHTFWENYVKKILGNANGMTNFERTRNRILYSQNKYETYSTTEYKKRIKRYGKPRGHYKKKK